MHAKKYIRMTLVLFLVIVVGCESVQRRVEKESIDDVTVVHRTLNPLDWRYGNYCGAGHPEKGNIGGSEVIRFLLNEFEPIDDIDEMCMYHDICYEELNDHDVLCHEIFMTTVRSFEFSTATEKCGFVVEDISLVFDSVIRPQLPLIVADMGTDSRDFGRGFNILALPFAYSYRIALAIIEPEYSVPRCKIINFSPKEYDRAALRASGTQAVEKGAYLTAKSAWLFLYRYDDSWAQEQMNRLYNSDGDYLRSQGDKFAF